MLSTINNSELIIDDLLARFSQKNVLVVGHSNTIPQLVEELGASSLCPDYFSNRTNGDCYLPSQDFDIMIIIKKPRFGDVSMSVVEYGDE
jgi:hypothetical protein